MFSKLVLERMKVKRSETENNVCSQDICKKERKGKVRKRTEHVSVFWFKTFISYMRWKWRKVCILTILTLHHLQHFYINFNIFITITNNEKIINYFTFDDGFIYNHSCLLKNILFNFVMVDYWFSVILSSKNIYSIFPVYKFLGPYDFWGYMIQLHTAGSSFFMIKSSCIQILCGCFVRVNL